MRLGAGRLAAFTLPAVPVAAIGLPVAVHLPPYFSGTLGLDLATVGVIFLAVRLIDLPLDVVFGQLMDHTRTRIGRFRPWFVSGALIMMAASAFVFMAPVGVTALATFAGLMAMYVGFSAFQLAHLAWAATLTPDYHQRSRVYGWIQTVNVAGLVAVLAIPALAAALLATGTPAGGIHAMGWFLIAILPISVVATLVAVREPAHPPVTHRITLTDLRSLFSNALMRRLLLADLLAGLAPGITASMFLFFFEARLGFSAAVSSGLLLVYFVAGLAAAPGWMRLAYRIGKHRAAVVAGAVFCVTSVGVVLLPPGDWAWAAIGMALAGTPFAAFPFLLRAMVADVIDAERLQSGRDRTGLFSSVLVTTTKVAHALPIGIVYPLLALIGFRPEPGAVNADAAITGMTLVFVLAPLAVMLGAMWVMARWPLGQAEHADVLAALAARGGD